MGNCNGHKRCQKMCSNMSKTCLSNVDDTAADTLFPQVSKIISNASRQLCTNTLAFYPYGALHFLVMWESSARHGAHLDI